jgi:uncharacterized membrane protein
MGATGPRNSTRQVVTQAMLMPPAWIRRFKRSLSIPGLLFGTIFFAMSLTPSLLPRGWIMQGVLSGLCMAAGYGIGMAYRWLWGYLELPLPDRRIQQWILWAAGGACFLVTLGFLWHASEWQDSVRLLLEMEPVDSARPIRVGLLAYLLFAGVVGISRLFHLTHRVIATRLGQGVPRRIANVVSLILAVMVFWAIIDGVIYQQTLRFADRTFERLDAREEAETAMPSDPARTGSAESLIAWDELGRTGRNFVSAIPTAEGLSTFHGSEVTDPIRVYVGLNAAESPEERAELALDELERVGAFQRSVLAIVIPTGTGWVDPAAITSLEYLHRGDVATVAVQYSYLPSWLTLLSEPQYGAETADALFEVIYGHWTRLPSDARPQLYLHGLSLGALNSQQSADLYDIIADPFHGALWVGPPFRSETWQDLTHQRDPASPAWLPRFRDGSVVRFMNQYEMSHPPHSPWGPLRIIYLQYASDPITFFEPAALYRSPQWLEEPRAPDVSDRVRWYPVVTMLQLLTDLAVGDASPIGYGHVYAVEDYIDAWIAVTDPPGWTEGEIGRLKTQLRQAQEDMEEPEEE